MPAEERENTVRLLSWRAFVAAISLIGGVAAAGAAGYLQLTVGKEPFFEPTDAGRFKAVALVTFVAVTSAFTRFFRVISLDAKEAKGRKVAAALRGLNKSVAPAVANEDISDKFGASAYIVRGYGPFRWLHRLERERVADLPLPSGIFWRPGKGVIGKRVKLPKEQVFDAGDFYRQHGHRTLTQWKTLDRDTRMGLRFRDFERIGDKYGTVIAVPMYSGETVIGCVAFDAPTGVHKTLVDADALSVVAAAAATVAGLLS